MSRTTRLLLSLLPGVGFLLALFGLPLVRVLVGSFSSQSAHGPAFSLDAWTSLLTNPVYLDGLWFSLWLGVAPTVLSFLVSLPLAALMQANTSSRRLFGTLYRIPLVVPGIVAAAMLSFALSLDDFIITYFVSGSTVTYPLYVNAATKAAVPPQINVLATAILMISLILLAVGTLYRRKRVET